MCVLRLTAEHFQQAFGKKKKQTRTIITIIYAVFGDPIRCRYLNSV